MRDICIRLRSRLSWVWGSEGRGEGVGKEGKPVTILLNVAFRPYDFGGKTSEHRRKLKLTKAEIH